MVVVQGDAVHANAHEFEIRVLRDDAGVAQSNEGDAVRTDEKVCTRADHLVADDVLRLFECDHIRGEELACRLARCLAVSDVPTIEIASELRPLLSKCRLEVSEPREAHLADKARAGRLRRSARKRDLGDGHARDLREVCANAVNDLAVALGHAKRRLVQPVEYLHRCSIPQ